MCIIVTMTDDSLKCDLCGVALASGSSGQICDTCIATPPVTVVMGGDGTPVAGDQVQGQSPVSSIPNHQILEKIGQGGMGTVHRARQDNLYRDVAVKVVNASHNYVGNLERFAREARIMAMLDHPNIVPVYDYGTDAYGRRAYSMKLVRGRTLEAILSSIRNGTETHTLQRLLRIFRKVCDGVGFAHSRGIIHRDLKPDNIMVGEFGEVLVMDWGLAADLNQGDTQIVAVNRPPVAERKPREREDGNSTSLTLEGEVLGTPQYMSPEQANGAADIDARTDVYALGGILYAILTLRPPVPKGDFYETIVNVRLGLIEPFEKSDPVPNLRHDLWRVPAPLLAVVRKAMALDREERFPAVRNLAADVDAYFGGFATSAEKINFAGQLWLLVKRHRGYSTAALLLIVITIGFMIRLIASERRANENAKAAQANATAATTAEKLALQKEESARHALAQARTMQADSAYAANDTRQMRVALNAVPADLRDARWQYLDARTDDRQALLKWQDTSFLIGSTPHPVKPGVFTVATNAGHHRIVDFDARTGEALKSFSYGEGWVRAIAYSPDTTRIAVGRIMEGGISIRKAEDGSELLQWKTDWVEALKFLPDGVRLLRTRTSGCDMWDSTTGKMLWRIPQGNIHLLVPKTERFVSVGETDIRIHSVTDGYVMTTYPVSPVTPLASSLSPDGSVLVVVHQDGRIRGVRLADGTTTFEAPAGEDGDIRRTAFTPDGQRIVTVAALEESGQTIQILDANTGRLFRRLRGGTGGVESMSIHPLSNDLLITSDGSTTYALPKSRPPSWTLEPGILGGFVGGNDLFLAPCGPDSIAAVTLVDGSLAWKPPSGFTNWAATDFKGTTGVAQAAHSPKDSRDFIVFRADSTSIRETAKFRFETDPRVIAVSCDGSRAAVAAPWGAVGTYRTANGEALPKIDRKTLEFTNGLAWHGSDPSKLLGVFARFGRRGNPASEEWIMAWDTSTGERTAEVRHESPLNCLATEPRGSRVAEGGDDKFVRIRDANSLALQREFRAHDSPIHAMAWNPVLPILATSGTDRAIRLWDVETGRMIEEVHIGLREATALRFSPNGKRLAASSPGARSLVWEFPDLDSELADVRKPAPISKK